MITGPGSEGRSGNVYAVDVHRRTAVGRNFNFEPTTIAMFMETVIGYLSNSDSVGAGRRCASSNSAGMRPRRKVMEIVIDYLSSSEVASGIGAVRRCVPSNAAGMTAVASITSLDLGCR